MADETEQWQDETPEYRRSDIDIDWSLEEPEPEVEVDPFSYVVGQDPGGTTGIACLRYTEDTLPELIYLHQQTGGQEGYFEFFGGAGHPDNVVYVSENFTIREGVHGADVTPLRIEGIQYALWQDGVVYQEPKLKPLIKDAWLKEQNLWTPGKPHQMDALRHALIYLRNSGHEPTIEALSDKREDTIAEKGEAQKKQLGESGSGEAAAQEAADAQSGEGEGEGEGQGEGGEGQGAGEGQGTGESQWTDENGTPQNGEGEGSGSVSHEDAGNGEGGRGGGEGDGNHEHGNTYVPPEVTVDKRAKRRELNGVFAGWDVAGDSEEVSLLDD